MCIYDHVFYVCIGFVKLNMENHLQITETKRVRNGSILKISISIPNNFHF